MSATILRPPMFSLHRKQTHPGEDTAGLPREAAKQRRKLHFTSLIVGDNLGSNDFRLTTRLRRHCAARLARGPFGRALQTTAEAAR